MSNQSACPGIFIAGSAQHSGKTLVSLGLVAALRQRGMNVRYMKPVGQRTVEVDGVRVDEDVVLINTVFELDSAPADCNPVTIPHGYTADFVANDRPREPLIEEIRAAYARLSADADIIVVEGTGHAGVGSVVGMSNAQVASILGAGPLIVTGGGLGQPLDEFCLNRAMFDREGCPLLGMVANKFLHDKMSKLGPLLEGWLGRHDSRLIGMIPYEPLLTRLTMRQIASETGAHLIHGDRYLDRPVDRIIIGAQHAHRLLQSLEPGTLAIIPGDRDDLLLAAISFEELSAEGGIIGICITGGIAPHPSVLELIERSQTPVIEVRHGTYDVASEVSDVVGKILPCDSDKIETGIELVARHIDVDALIEAATQ